MWFERTDGNVIVTVIMENGKIRRVERVSKLDQDAWDDRLSIHSADDEDEITSVKMSKVKKITIEIV